MGRVLNRRLVLFAYDSLRTVIGPVKSPTADLESGRDGPPRDSSASVPGGRLRVAGYPSQVEEMPKAP